MHSCIQIFSTLRWGLIRGNLNCICNSHCDWCVCMSLAGILQLIVVTAVLSLCVTVEILMVVQCCWEAYGLLPANYGWRLGSHWNMEKRNKEWF